MLFFYFYFFVFSTLLAIHIPSLLLSPLLFLSPQFSSTPLFILFFSFISYLVFFHCNILLPLFLPSSLFFISLSHFFFLIFFFNSSFNSFINCSFSTQCFINSIIFSFCLYFSNNFLNSGLEFCPLDISVFLSLTPKVFSSNFLCKCYNLGLELSERHTLVLSNTRELNRVSKYRSSTLYMNYCWSVLHFFSLTLMTMCYSYCMTSLSLEPSMSFYCITWACDLYVTVTDVTTKSRICDMWHHILSSSPMSK